MGVIKKQGIQNTIIVYTGILIGMLNLLYIQPHFLRNSEELGLIRVLLSFGSLLAAVFPLGAPNVVVKYLPKFYAPQKKHHGFFGLMLIFPAIGILVGCIGLYFAKDWLISVYSEKSKLFTDYFHLVIPLALSITFIFTLNAYSNAVFRTIFPSFLNDILNRILLIGIILLYYWGFLDLNQFAFSFMAIYVLQAVLILLYVLTTGNPSIKVDKKYLKEKVGFKFIFRYGLILSVTSVAAVAIKFLDSIFLAKESLSWVGIYSIAAFIGLIIETPLNSLERIANTKIAHHIAESNHSEIKKIYFTSSRYLMLLGGFLSLMVIVNIHDLLLLLPAEYRAAELITIVIAAGAFINMATGINYPILINSSKYIWGSFFLLILLVVALVSNYFLVPKYGMLGAAIATSASSAFYNLLKFGFIWKNFGMQPFDMKSIKILLIIAITIISGILIPSLENAFASLIIKSAVCGSMFLMLTYLMKIVPEFHKHIPFLRK